MRCGRRYTLYDAAAAAEGGSRPARPIDTRDRLTFTLAR